MPEKERKALPTVALRNKDWVKSSAFVHATERDYCLTNAADLPGLVDQIVADCRDRLLPILDACRSTADLDRMLNTDPLASSMFFNGYISRMDMHLLDGVPGSQPAPGRPCEDVLRNIRGNQYVEAARKCVDYIRSHPLP